MPAAPTRSSAASHMEQAMTEEREAVERWIEWNGGECPVEPDTVVEVRLRDGWEARLPDSAREFRWCWTPTSGRNFQSNGVRAFDIIAYRVVQS